MESNFSEKEKNTVKFWKENKIFEKSVKKPAPKGGFVFFEGPPTANARPGIHHVETRVVKDMVCRYKTMRGFRVQRRAGWDTHGLPVELQIEKKLGLHNKKEIEQYGIKEFNKECRDSVFEQIGEWRKLSDRIGYWLDMDNAYVTYDRPYMESVWFILKRAWEKKLLFQDYKVVPYCSRCGTALSSHEVAQGYKKVKDPSVFVRFRILNPEIKNTSLLVWTTTPWTLPANVAAAVNPKMDYVKAKLKEGSAECFILAKSRFAVLGDGYEIVEEMTGENLAGLRYQAVFPVSDESEKTIYKVIAADFVSLEDGTGIVHIAPAFGAEDMEAIKKQNKQLRKDGLPEFPVIVNVGEDGAFTYDVPKWFGIFVKDADKSIIEDLESRGLLFRQEPHEHDYPFCWRCKTPLLYYAKMSWFIRMTELRDELIKNNQKINWTPAYLKDGRFGEWLREVKDWAVSRDRYWGTPLPAWKCSCGHTEIIDSVNDILSRDYSKNRYFIFRHGHSGRQMKKIASCWPEADPLPLTELGKKQVLASAKKLSKDKVDVIISSDILRTKETAAIISKATGAKIVYDKRLRELNVGEFNGGDPKKFWDYLATQKNRFSAKPAKGESLISLRRRVYDFMKEIDKKYERKTIVLVSHEMPLTMMEWTTKGMGLEEITEGRYSGKLKKIETGAYRPLVFKMLPFNDDMEIDLHRPFIDAVAPFCVKCNDRMRRVPEVLDCWLDSGAMPFAQDHWPFKKGQTAKKAPELFPADFISEAIDQTRGWFYTLLSVSTVLGFGAPYKNVVSMGHVLDDKGEKMSKSKGNIINPWEMVEKYGADAVRWYFYTVNDPGDPKLYNEKDLDLALKKFLMTFWNCHVFLQTYAPGIKAPLAVNPVNVLDWWIISRLEEAVVKAGELMDKYDITAAARLIESFTINDLSLWYVRRSRRRLQQPASKLELKEAANIFAYVLFNLAKISAPFIPFLSEEVYQGLSGNNYAKAKSVHLEAWPIIKKKAGVADAALAKGMDKVRELVALVLAERAKHAVKVRQPLAKLVVGGREKLSNELRDLLIGEVNVRAVEFDPELKTAIEIDWTITPELKEEGLAREIMRNVQELRKTAQFTPADKAVVYVQAEGELAAVVLKNQQMMAKETKALRFEFKKAENPAAEIQAVVDKQPIWIGIKKC
jgi:isoleucyl-tRNA synthetase